MRQADFPIWYPDLMFALPSVTVMNETLRKVGLAFCVWAAHFCRCLQLYMK